jgi:Transposase, Mutator family
VRVRLDRQATSISLLVVLGVRTDGQKVFMAIKNMGGESTEAWRAVLDDLIGRGLRRPQFLIVDGAPGLERRSQEVGSDFEFVEPSHGAFPFREIENLKNNRADIKSGKRVRSIVNEPLPRQPVP